MQQIVPHLWFDKEAREAVQLYTSLFPGSRIVTENIVKDTPSGDAVSITFELAGQPFAAISAGSLFRFNPSVSLMVACECAEEVDRLWDALIPGGIVLMERGAYPFNPHYGWLADRYGLSWQLGVTEDPIVQKITVNFLFSGPVIGRAEEAVRYYTEVFPQANLNRISHYAEGEAVSEHAKVNFVGFSILGQHFSAMDHAYPEDFTFTEAFSLMVLCDTQAEIDKAWSKLSHVPEAEACGWIKDRFGLSWQIVPRILQSMLGEGTEEQRIRVTQTMLTLKKLDIQTLADAYQGKP